MISSASPCVTELQVDRHLYKNLKYHMKIFITGVI